MKTMAECGRQVWIYSRKLTIAGTIVPLFLLPFTARGDVITNITESGARPAMTNVGKGRLTAETIFAQGITPLAASKSRFDTNGNPITIENLSPSLSGSMRRQGFALPIAGTTNLASSGLAAGEVISSDAGAGFVAANVPPNSTSIPKREGATLDLGTSGWVLQDPGSAAIHRQGALAETSLSLGDLGRPVVRFFVPYSHPSPPGGGRDLVSGESDRSWPVISASATTGRCWNEPSTYQAQGFLSISW